MTKPLTPEEKARRAYVRSYDRWWAKHPGVGQYSDPTDPLLRPRRPIDVREGIKIAELQGEIYKLLEENRKLRDAIQPPAEAEG